METKEYDVIFSLGGSCLMAKQIKHHRNLQICSFPFDWLSTGSENHIMLLTKCFVNNFKKFFLYENLVELQCEERGNGNVIQYRDRETQFNFIHDFTDFKENYKEYEAIRIKYKRRIERLYTILGRARTALLLLDVTKPVSIQKIEQFMLVIKNKFPNCLCDFIGLHFNENIRMESSSKQNIIIYNILRRRTTEDFLYKNDSHFFDSLRLSEYGRSLQER